LGRPTRATNPDLNSGDARGIEEESEAANVIDPLFRRLVLLHTGKKAKGRNLEPQSF
jgi:hypothetical protein